MTKDQELRSAAEKVAFGGWYMLGDDPGARFINAANPQAVLALLSRAEKAEEDRDMVVGQLAASREMLQQAEARATQAEAQRDRLTRALQYIAAGETPPEQHGHYLAHRKAVEAARSALSTRGGGEGFIAARELPPSDAAQDAAGTEPAVVHLVTASVGEYSDRREWPVVAFVHDADAMAFVEAASALSREACIILDGLDDYATEHAYEKAVGEVIGGFSTDFGEGPTYRAGPVELRAAFEPLTLPAPPPAPSDAGRDGIEAAS